jgi:hypothetical protein
VSLQNSVIFILASYSDSFKTHIKIGSIMIRKITTFSLTAIALLTLTGCAAKNVTIEKIDKGSNILNLNTSASLADNNIKVNNDINYEDLYVDQKCYDESHYHGLGTNYLKLMFGFKTYFLNDQKKISEPNHNDIVSSWILSPLFLPLAGSIEIIFLQPFYDYKYEHQCDYSDTKKNDPKKEIDFGKFTGVMKVQNNDTKQIKEFKFNDQPFPLKLVLEDETDMMSTSKHSIGNTHNYTVNIEGMYKATPSSTAVPLKLTKEIKE